MGLWYCHRWQAAPVLPPNVTTTTTATLQVQPSLIVPTSIPPDPNVAFPALTLPTESAGEEQETLVALKLLLSSHFPVVEPTQLWLLASLIADTHTHEQHKEYYQLQHFSATAMKQWQHCQSNAEEQRTNALKRYTDQIQLLQREKEHLQQQLQHTSTALTNQKQDLYEQQQASMECSLHREYHHLYMTTGSIVAFLWITLESIHLFDAHVGSSWYAQLQFFAALLLQAFLSAMGLGYFGTGLFMIVVFYSSPHWSFHLWPACLGLTVLLACYYWLQQDKLYRRSQRVHSIMHMIPLVVLILEIIVLFQHYSVLIPTKNTPINASWRLRINW